VFYAEEGAFLKEEKRSLAERGAKEPCVKRKKNVALEGSVSDFGRPSISGSIRSIKMYSWA
jgi:hypothetical protein